MKDPTGTAGGDSGQRRGLRSRQALAYQGAFEAVASILIGGGLGYFADRHFGTDPYLLLVGFAFGFGALFVRLDRLRRALESEAGEGQGENGKD